MFSYKQFDRIVDRSINQLIDWLIESVRDFYLIFSLLTFLPVKFYDCELMFCRIVRRHFQAQKRGTLREDEPEVPETCPALLLPVVFRPELSRAQPGLPLRGRSVPHRREDETRHRAQDPCRSPGQPRFQLHPRWTGQIPGQGKDTFPDITSTIYEKNSCIYLIAMMSFFALL